MITVLGPTATGKTAFAVELAGQLDGEIISADSRQVYRGMDIGTGKDLEEYVYQDDAVPYHLVDIVDPGYEYNVFEYQRDFLKVYQEVMSRNKLPIMVGGTGMYLEAVLKGYRLLEVPENRELREVLEKQDHGSLVKRLATYGKVHNTTDTSNRERLLRAIEIQEYNRTHASAIADFPKMNHVLFGIHFDRSEIRSRITQRLRMRLENGMIQEVEGLLDAGVSPEQLMFYGLEYRYLTQFVSGQIAYDEMFQLLNTAIHQFAKRQVTWFRRMERNGFLIHWIDGHLALEEKTRQALKILHDTNISWRQ